MKRAGLVLLTVLFVSSVTAAGSLEVFPSHYRRFKLPSVTAEDVSVEEGSLSQATGLLVTVPYRNALRNCKDGWCVGKWTYQNLCPGTTISFYVPPYTAQLKVTFRNRYRYEHCREIDVLVFLDSQPELLPSTPDDRRVLTAYPLKEEAVHIEDLVNQKALHLEGSGRAYIYLLAVKDLSSFERNVTGTSSLFSGLEPGDPAARFLRSSHVLNVYLASYVDEMTVEVTLNEKTAASGYVYQEDGLKKADTCQPLQVCGNVMGTYAETDFERLHDVFEPEGRNVESAENAPEPTGVEKHRTIRNASLEVSNGNLEVALPDFGQPADVYVGVNVAGNVYVYGPAGDLTPLTSSGKIAPVIAGLQKELYGEVPLEDLPNGWIFEAADKIYLVAVPHGVSPLDPNARFLAALTAGK